MVLAFGIDLKDGIDALQQIRMSILCQHILRADDLLPLLTQVLGQVVDIERIEHQCVFQIAAAPRAAFTAERDASVGADVFHVLFHFELLPQTRKMPQPHKARLWHCSVFPVHDTGQLSYAAASAGVSAMAVCTEVGSRSV